MGRVSQYLFLSTLTLLLAIIFLGLFCLPHTISYMDPPGYHLHRSPRCDAILQKGVDDAGDPDCEPLLANTNWCTCVRQHYCIKKQGRSSCSARCLAAPICNNFKAKG